MRKLFRQAWLPALLLVLLGLMIRRTELATLAAGVGLFVLGIDLIAQLSRQAVSLA